MDSCRERRARFPPGSRIVALLVPSAFLRFLVLEYDEMCMFGAKSRPRGRILLMEGSDGGQGSANSCPCVAVLDLGTRRLARFGLHLSVSTRATVPYCSKKTRDFERAGEWLVVFGLSQPKKSPQEKVVSCLANCRRNFLGHLPNPNSGLLVTSSHTHQWMATHGTLAVMQLDLRTMEHNQCHPRRFGDLSSW